MQCEKLRSVTEDTDHINLGAWMSRQQVLGLFIEHKEDSGRETLVGICLVSIAAIDWLWLAAIDSLILADHIVGLFECF
jgi:hypothetical protein